MNTETNQPDKNRGSKDNHVPCNVQTSNAPQSAKQSSLFDDFDATMTKIRSGDKNAVGELTQACRDYLLLIANQEMDHDLNRKLGASDIVQNTMVAIHKNMSEFRGQQPEQFMAWIRKILLNDLSRERRRFKDAAKRDTKREKSIGGDSRLGHLPIEVRDTELTPQTNAVRQEEEKLLELALQQISEEHQSVIRLRNLENLSFAEIGKRLNRSDDAAQKLWTRAIEKLRERLNAMNAF